MKKSLYLSVLLAGLLSFQNAFGQQNQAVDTISVKVNGVCEMCKARIENAALIGGVKFAEWDKESKMLTVVYKTKKVTSLDVQKAVAEFGHDSEDVVAKEEDYKELPFCCEYRDGKETH